MEKFSRRENEKYHRHRREKIWLDYWQIIIIAGKTIPGGKTKIAAITARSKYKKSFPGGNIYLPMSFFVLRESKNYRRYRRELHRVLVCA